MRKYVILLLSLFLIQNANAFSLDPTPRVSIHLDRGMVRYHTHLSQHEFKSRNKVKVHPGHIVAGLTVPNSQISYRLILKTRIKRNETIALIDQIKFNWENDIQVFIDKKYSVGTCEYRVIKEHENYHVRVSQEAPSFFRRDIEKRLKRIAKNIKPRRVHNDDEATAYLKEQQQFVIREMEPLMQHIFQKIEEKNAAIDTEESYKNTWAVCR